MLTYNFNLLLLLTIFVLFLNKCSPSLRRNENIFSNISKTHFKTSLPKNITKHNNISNPIIKERKIISASEKDIEGKQNKSDDTFEVNYVEEYGGHDEDEFSRSYHNKGSKGYQDDEMFDKEDGADYLMKNGDDISQVKIDQSLINKDIGKRYTVHSQTIANLDENNKNDKQENVQKLYKPIEISLLKNSQNNIQNVSLNGNENLKFQNEREVNINRGNIKSIPKSFNKNIPETVYARRRNCPFITLQYPKYVGSKIKEPIIDTTNAETNIRSYKDNSNVKPRQADVSGGYEAFIIHKRPSDNDDNDKKSYNKKNYKNGEDNPDSIINYYPINRKEPKIKYKGKKRIKKINKILKKKLNEDQSKAENSSQTDNDNDDNHVDTNSDKDDYSDYNDDYVEEDNKETIKNFKKAIEKNAENIVNKKRKSKDHKMQVTSEKKKSETYDNENDEKQEDNVENIENKYENDYDYNNENDKRSNTKPKVKNNTQRKNKHYKYNEQNDNKPRNRITSRKTILAQELSDGNTSKRKFRRKEIPEKKKYRIINNRNDENQSVNKNDKNLENKKKKDKIFNSRNRNNFKLREKKLNPKQLLIKKKKIIRERMPEKINSHDNIQNQKTIKKVFKHRKNIKQKLTKENPTTDYEDIEIDENVNKNFKQNDNYDYYDDKPLNNQKTYNTDKNVDKNNEVQLKIKNNEDYYDSNESDYEDDSESVNIKQNSQEYNYDDDNHQSTKNNDLEDYYEALTEDLGTQNLKVNHNKTKMKQKERYQSNDDYIDDQEDDNKLKKSCNNCDYPSSEYTNSENDDDDDYNDY